MKLLFVLLLCCASTNAATYYASPTGSGTACSIGSPCGLQSGLDKLIAGDTLLLRGGTYTGRFTSSASCSSGSPCYVKSYCANVGLGCGPGGVTNPSEWATLEGYFTATLNGAITSGSTQLTLSGAQSGLFAAGQDVLIDNEVILLNSLSSGTTFNILRGQSGGGAAASHSTGATVLPAVGEVLLIASSGQYVTYQDFRVTNSNPTRDYPDVSADVQGRRITCIDDFAPHSKLINLVVDNGLNGVGFWDTATNSDIYGVVTFNNGMDDTERSHGHGIYTQNPSGQGSKTIKEVVSFNNYATGAKAFGVSGPASDYFIEGVVSFNNGSSGTFSGNSAGYGTDKRWVNLLVGTQSAGVDNITVQNCYAYHPSGVKPEQNNMAAAYDAGGNGTGTWQNNYILGSGQSFKAKDWTNFTFTGNTVFTTVLTDQSLNEETIRLQRAGGPASNYHFSNNTYWDTTTPFTGCGSARLPFRDSETTSPCNSSLEGPLSFAQWQAIAAGWDTGSTHTETAPTSNVTVVRPNVYDANRANVIIMNWTHANSVSVDVSSLGWNNGDSYSIIAYENFPTVSQTGTISGSTVSFTCNGSTVVAPVGNPSGFAAASVRPEFAVFVIARTAQASTASSVLGASATKGSSWH